LPELRIVLTHDGQIDPARLESYRARGGFSALATVRREMSPEDVIQLLSDAGLRGRGGAGFPTGLKWRLARQAPGDEKFVICNADEGEVGTFKDRHIIQHDPFSLFEGIAIAGHAVGAAKGYIYLRAEYHYLLGAFQAALAQVVSGGLLGEFVIEIREGAGAYVCGEESALMDSIEGRRGEVRYRPPFPPDHGLWQQPTVIDNVETLMNVPRIVENDAAWFAAVGTEKSQGTKVFSVSGDVARPGVYEMVMGSPLRELVVDLAGADDVKMVQMGGSTGRLVPAEELDTPLSFEGVLGAGAVTVFNTSRSVIEVTLRNMEFLAEESCGKCVPCREGTSAMTDILTRFKEGAGREADIEVLERLAETMQLAALCGLGQAAPIPITDGLRLFRAEYEGGMLTAAREVAT
jgi:NADH:ubiquinone oxidoreductase subunit F (NADH-binding)